MTRPLLPLFLAGFMAGSAPAATIAERFPPPAGLARPDAAAGSFAAWLRALPLKPGKPPVLLYDGREKGRRDVHLAVVDMEIGGRDLQQCADAVIRLRAEYLWSAGGADAVRFRFVSGFLASWPRWREGWRPVVSGSRVHETRSRPPCASHACFRAYLDAVFTYANSWSLARELAAVPDAAGMQPGDVFIQGGFPGHAVIVADMAEGAQGRRVFLLLQSYMPAQEIHVLKNPADGTAWYALDFGPRLETPEWTFRRSDLRRFR